MAVELSKKVGLIQLTYEGISMVLSIEEICSLPF
jgi:hypothetical protein